MKAVLLDAPGSPDTLRIGEAPMPVPGPGEVRVKVRACGLNPVDWKVFRGWNPRWATPHIGGLDAAGIVDCLGEGVTDFSLGDHVVFHGDLNTEGGFAQYVVTEALVLAHIPDGVSFEAAAALPCAGMTAYQAIVRRLHVGPEDTVFITAGSSAVGGFAIQLAARSGARVITTASKANEARVRNLGADEVIDHHTQDIHARVLELTDGIGVDGIVDVVSAESATSNLTLLRHGGGLAAIADRPDWSVIEAFTVAPSVHEIALGAAHGFDDRAKRMLSRDLETLLHLVATQGFDSLLARTVTMSEVPDALADIKTGHVVGKTVMVVD